MGNPNHDARGRFASVNERKKDQAVLSNDYLAYEQASDEQKKDETEKNLKTFVHAPEFRNVKKMPALFSIDREAHVATENINPNAAWIFEEPSKATLKKDGTSITVNERGEFYARRMVKKGKKAPEGFIPAETDAYTGHTFGLEPIEQSGFAKMFRQAAEGKVLSPGTYKLCGPKINGNPEGLEAPALMQHGEEEASEIPDMRTMPKEEAFSQLKAIFADYKNRGIEGVVWWGADGKRAKLRVKDFFGDPNRR